MRAEAEAFLMGVQWCIGKHDKQSLEEGRAVALRLWPDFPPPTRKEIQAGKRRDVDSLERNVKDNL